MSLDNKDIIITSAVRTAIGTFRGSLKDMQAKDLGALVTKAAIQKSNLDSTRLCFISGAQSDSIPCVSLDIIYFFKSLINSLFS